MHIGSRTASRLGIPDALGQQTHRRSRSHRARARTDESPQRTRLTDMAGLSVGALSLVLTSDFCLAVTPFVSSSKRRLHYFDGQSTRSPSLQVHCETECGL